MSSVPSSRRLKKRWLNAIGALHAGRSSQASTSRQPTITLDLLDCTLGRINVSDHDDALWVVLACVDAIEGCVSPLQTDHNTLRHLLNIGLNASNSLATSSDDTIHDSVQVLKRYQSMFLVWDKVYGDEADRYASRWTTDAPTPIGEDDDEEELSAWADLAETTPSPVAPQSLRTSALDFSLSSPATQALQIALSGQSRQLASFLRAMPSDLSAEVWSMRMTIVKALLMTVAAAGGSLSEIVEVGLLPRAQSGREEGMWSQLTDNNDAGSPDELFDFYRSAVLEVEEQVARVDFALDLCNLVSSFQLGIELEQEHIRLQENLTLLSTLVYRDSSPSSGMTLMRFRELLAVATASNARNLLAMRFVDGIADANAFQSAFDNGVVQLMHVLARRECEASDQHLSPDQLSLAFLHEFLLFLADSHKTWMLLHVLQGGTADSKLILSPEQRLRLLLATLLSSQSFDLQTANLLNTVGRAALESFSSQASQASPSQQGLGSVLVSAQRGKAASEFYKLFERSELADLFLFLKQVRALRETSQRLAHFVDDVDVHSLAALQGNHDEQKAFVLRIVRSFSRSAGHAQQYAQLADVLRSSVGVGHAFDQLGEVDVARAVIESAARAGDVSVFDQVLRAESDGLLNAQEQETLVVEAAEELYDNATSANLHQGDMKVAYELLSRPHLQASQRVQRFKAFIEATSKLCAYRVPSEIYAGASLLTPIEIRLSEDRLMLIRRLLDSRDDAYRTADLVLDIAQKLCAVPPGARRGAVQDVEQPGTPARTEIENRTLAMLIDAALAHGDYDSAQSSCDRLVGNAVALGKRVEQMGIHSAGQGDDGGQFRQTTQQFDEVKGLAHRTSHQLSKQPDWNDEAAKLRWAGFALAFCPAEQLSQYLKAWRQIAEAVEEDLRRNPPKALLYDQNSSRPRFAAVGGGAGSLGGLGAALQAHTGGLSAAGLAALSQFGGSMESYANPLGALLARAPSAMRPLTGSQRGRATDPAAATVRSSSVRSNASSVATGGERGGPGQTSNASPISRAARLFDGLGGPSGEGGGGSVSTPSEGQPGYMDPAERAARAARRFFHGLGAGF